MDKLNIKHSKKRNTALLYEFFIRHISKCFLENKKDEAKKALSIMKRYFHIDSVLNEELELFKNITDSQGKLNSKDLIGRVIGEVLIVSEKIDDKTLNRVKSNLIKEINTTFDANQFYSYRIPNYTVLASIQTLLNETRLQQKNLSPIQKVALQESISSFLVEEVKKENKLGDFSTEHGTIIYKVVTKKFNEKYSNLLTENQKKLLTKYAVCLASNNKQNMKSFLGEQVKEISKSLTEIKDKAILKDKDLMTKINECKKCLMSGNKDDINDKDILQLLKYMELVEEIKK